MKQEVGEVSGSIQVRGDSLVVKVPEELARRKLLGVVRKSNVKVASQEYQGLAVDDSKGADAKLAASRAATNAPVATPATEATVSQSDSSNGEASPSFTLPLLSVQLPPEADGELDVTLYDQSVEPARLVYRQQVNRPSVRGLNIDIEQKETTFTPQQELQLGLRATDHNGNAVPHSWFALRIVRADSIETLSEVASPAVPTRVTRRTRQNPSAAVAADAASRFAPVFQGASTAARAKRKDAVAKKAPQDEAAKKADPEREAMEIETRLKKAQAGSESPAKVGAKPALPAPASPGGFDKLSGSRRSTLTAQCSPRGKIFACSATAAI